MKNQATYEAVFFAAEGLAKARSAASANDSDGVTVN
jgi:hypothetical protein